MLILVLLVPLGWKAREVAEMASQTPTTKRIYFGVISQCSSIKGSI
jgi:hypothetical protein